MAFLRGPTNFVQSMMMSNCQRPFYIYLTTAIPCLVEAIIMLRMWDFGDMVRKTAEAASHGGLRRPPKGRHMRPRKASPLRGSGKERFYKSFLKHLLIMTQPLEYVGFALLLYGVVDRFYFNWAMYIDDADACIDPGFYGNYIRRTTDGDAHPIAGGNALQLPDLIHDGANWGGTSISVSVPIGRYKVAFAATVEGPGGGASYKLIIVATGVLGSGVFESETVFCGDGEETDIIADADIFIASPVGGVISWRIAGPPVPVGLRIPRADIFIQRQAEAISSPA